MARLVALTSLALLLGTTGSSEAMIAPSLVRDVVRAAYPRIRACTGNEPVRAPGTIVVHFIIGPDGRVTEATVTRDDIGRRALAECVALTVLDLQFPTIDGGTISANYPFRFEP